LSRANSTTLAPEHTPVDASLPEVKESANHTLSVEVPRNLLDPTQYSSYWTLLRATAWILRFRRIGLRMDGHSGNLTALELETARSYWIQAVQGGMLRCGIQGTTREPATPRGLEVSKIRPLFGRGIFCLGGRLQFAKLSREQRHPLLLDGQHHFTKLLILQTHIRINHIDVRIILA
jgi:hypothetical protein